MGTTHPTTRATRSFFKLRAYPFDVFSSRLWFFDGSRPTNPLIAGERREIFPCPRALGSEVRTFRKSGGRSCATPPEIALIIRLLAQLSGQTGAGTLTQQHGCLLETTSQCGPGRLGLGDGGDRDRARPATLPGNADRPALKMRKLQRR